ncbi:hypothetical protein BaRGS_00012851 [Batillaria attramentaria]|uniref:Uncharacterized protein n=1 Tax=Batillaria attramentaria TaxID=370345 RepID=A0ABD0L9A8_9CAEN
MQPSSPQLLNMNNTYQHHVNSPTCFYNRNCVFWGYGCRENMGACTECQVQICVRDNIKANTQGPNPSTGVDKLWSLKRGNRHIWRKSL